MIVKRATAMVLVLLLGGAASLAAQGDPERHPGLGQGETHVRGFITDRSTNEPLSGTSVVLRAVNAPLSGLRVTASDGTFQFAEIPAGVYELEIRHLGFQDAHSTVEMEAGGYVDLRVHMVPAAVELDPLVVASERRDRLATAGFYDRRRVSTGHFMTRDEIQDRRVHRVSQLFRGIAGFSVIPSRQNSDQMVVGRGNCQPSLYIDGILMRTVAAWEFDQVLQPDHLEGLEVYSASQTPGQFLAGRCGTIVAWTHTPTDADGHPFEWTRLGAAAGLVVAVFTLMF